MKLCFIADATAVHTVRWVEYFSNSGYDVHLITYEPPSEPIPEVHLHIVNSVFSNLYLAFPFRHIKIMRIIRQIKPDIVHAHFITKFGFHGALLGFHPLVMSAWGSDVLVIPGNSKLLWYFTKFSLRKADLIYAASRDIMDKIIDNFGVSSEKVKVNTHGVDVGLFCPMLDKLVQNAIIVFSNRNFYPVYNIKTLIDAIPLTISKNSNIKFWIMGKGPEEKELKQHAIDIGVNQYIDFIDWIDFEDMPKYLNSCDIYVSTALSDGTPVSMLEAMACGKPCIITDVGGVSEWIKDDVMGLLVKPGQPKELANKIIELAGNSEKRTMMGNNAHNLVVKSANKSEIMSGVELDYINLANKYSKT